MSTQRLLTRGLLPLVAVFALVAIASPSAAAAAGLSHTARANTGAPTDSVLRSSITVHLYNGLVASLAGIPGATLTLSNSSGAIAAKVVSDASGAATLIAAPGAYKLRVSASGYQPVEMIVKIATYSSELQVAMMPLVITDPWVHIGPTDN
jgi:Carboxypeptidase regulatory-like domain